MKTITLLFVSSLLFSPSTFAASATASANQYVVESISINYNTTGKENFQNPEYENNIEYSIKATQVYEVIESSNSRNRVTDIVF